MNFYDFLEQQEPENEIKFVKIKKTRFKKYLDGMLKLFR